MAKYKNFSRMAENAQIPVESLRTEFNDTLLESGHIHVARVVDRTKRCSCIALRDDRHNEPDPRCEICDSLGFLYTDLEILARKSYESGLEQAASPQRMRAPIMSFYVKHDVFANRTEAEYSRLMEIQMNDDGTPAPGNIIIGKYNIKEACPYTEKGVLIYWRLIVARKDI